MTLDSSLLNEEPTGSLKKAALGTWGVVFLVVSAAAPLSVPPRPRISAAKAGRPDRRLFGT